MHDAPNIAMLNYTFTPSIITPPDGRELQTEQKYVVRVTGAPSGCVGALGSYNSAPLPLNL